MVELLKDMGRLEFEFGSPGDVDFSAFRAPTGTTRFSSNGHTGSIAESSVRIKVEKPDVIPFPEDAL